MRNKHLSKRDTEKSIKEIWKARLEDRQDGQASELPDFIFQHWQKKVGIASAVVEVSSTDSTEKRKCNLDRQGCRDDMVMAELTQEVTVTPTALCRTVQLPSVSTLPVLCRWAIICCTGYTRRRMTPTAPSSLTSSRRKLRSACSHSVCSIQRRTQCSCRSCLGHAISCGCAHGVSVVVMSQPIANATHLRRCTECQLVPRSVCGWIYGVRTRSGCK